MKIRSRLTNLGISLEVGEFDDRPLEKDSAANQTAPRGCYIYAHVDEQGGIFYIGKGTGRRAWSEDRHPLHHRYIEKHLKGQYAVLILKDGLSAQDVEILESDWIAQQSSTLVNWVNMGRGYDMEALERYHLLRNQNRERIAKGRVMEQSDLQGAIAVYQQALESLATYASIHYETGLIGQLLLEERDEVGLQGDLHILDRLTLCLKRAGRLPEAAEVVKSYFDAYRADLRLAAAAAIYKRVQSTSRPPAPKRK